MKAKIIGKRVMLPKLTVAAGERLVDKIVFYAPAVYGDVDLTALEAFANIRRADSTTDKIVLAKDGEGEEFNVTLPIDATVTAVAGELEARISFESEEGKVVYMTERFFLDVESSIDAFTDYTDREPNALYEQRKLMAEYVSAMQDLVDEFNAMLDDYRKNGLEVKVTAENVSGLAKVATSGSYNDLSDLPDLSSIGGGGGGGNPPFILEYISTSFDTNKVAELRKTNRAVMAEFVKTAPTYSQVYIKRTDDDTGFVNFYPYYRLRELNNNISLFFQFDSETTYSITYNKSTDTYVFVE